MGLKSENFTKNVTKCRTINDPQICIPSGDFHEIWKICRDFRDAVFFIWMNFLKALRSCRGFKPRVLGFPKFSAPQQRNYTLDPRRSSGTRTCHRVPQSPCQVLTQYCMIMCCMQRSRVLTLVLRCTVTGRARRAHTRTAACAVSTVRPGTYLAAADDSSAATPAAGAISCPSAKVGQLLPAIMLTQM